MANPVTPQEALTGFNSMLTSYEHRIGHSCRAVAQHLPPLLPPLSPHATLLDNACGTGAATQAFLAAHPTLRVSAADAVPAMVDAVRTLDVPQLVDLRVQDAQSLTYADDSFDVSVTNFGVFYFPDPVVGAEQIYRTLKVGGVAVVTVWKTLGFKPILWEVQSRLKPRRVLGELPLVEPWCDAVKLEGVLTAGGFGHVEFRTVTVGMWGRDRRDFVDVLVENFMAMTMREWDGGERARIPEVTERVVGDMEGEFCVRDGDRVGCVMEAWVAICRK